MSNSTKDLLASVKCCLSDGIYQKDKIIRYGSVRTDIIYDSIISRIIYDMMSDTQGFNDGSIQGYYTITSYTVDGVEQADSDNPLILIIDEENLSTPTIPGSESTPYTEINDKLISYYEVLVSATVLITFDGEGNATYTFTDGGEVTVVTLKKITSSFCFSSSDFCEMYEYLNNKCKTC